jgi:hypothetical protein
MTTPAQPLYAVYDSLGGGVTVGGAGSGAELFQFSSPSLAQAQALTVQVANLLQRTLLLVPVGGAPPYTAYPSSLAALGFATATGNATATGATSLTNSGASFPIATAGTTTTPPTNGLVGQIVAAGPNASGVGAVVWGIITANTATVLTVALWVNPASATGAAGSTPNATASYQVFSPVPPVSGGLSGISF